MPASYDIKKHLLIIDNMGALGTFLNMGKSFSPGGLALQALPSVAGLLFGENSLFSGKARQASNQLMSNFQKSQAAPFSLGWEFK